MREQLKRDWSARVVSTGRNIKKIRNLDIQEILEVIQKIIMIGKIE